ncbi:MAG: hypothetical protein IJ956_01575, partial [Akkermansia sp.]|nr:hypothetical protein [Akkermansia sp.]
KRVHFMQLCFHICGFEQKAGWGGILMPPPLVYGVQELPASEVDAVAQGGVGIEIAVIVFAGGIGNGRKVGPRGNEIPFFSPGGIRPPGLFLDLAGEVG